MAQFDRKVLVVDDEPIIRNLIAERLTQFGFQTFTAADALSAKRITQKEDPDALVVDLDLGDGPTGIELITALNAANPTLGFVLLTHYQPSTKDLGGASHIEYLNKGRVSDISVLVDTLERVLKGDQPTTLPDLLTGELGKLTQRQLEVLGLLSRGMTNQEIALRRQVGIRAVEQTVRRIYVALCISGSAGISPRVMAAKLYAREIGLTRDME